MEGPEEGPQEPEQAEPVNVEDILPPTPGQAQQDAPSQPQDDLEQAARDSEAL